jgi:hypothetical protein
LGAGLGLGLVLVFVARRLRARRTPDSLLPVPVSKPGASADPSLAASGAASMRAALLPHLAGILREKFVAALMSHRSELLETQQAGAAQAEALEERLQKVQGELAERVKGFERRITELELALAVAEEQKRGLIQAQIDLTKQLLAQARQAENQGRFGRENLGSN